jgi:hypothetical protein
MLERMTADRKILVTEVVITGREALILRKAAFLEAGDTYWVDLVRQELMVEDRAGRQRRLAGAFETRCSG